MKRLIENLGKNSPEEYAGILLQRTLKGTDERDLKRWNKLVKFYRGGRFIDLGCLDSLAPILIKERYPKEEVWGLDYSRAAIEEMQQRYPYIYYQQGDVYDTKFPANYFSYITAGELLEHLDNPANFIKEAMRILKRGGTLALSTPLEETGAGEVDKDRHIWSFSIEDMDMLLGPYGKVTVKIMGSEYFPKYAYHFPTIICYCQKT